MRGLHVLPQGVQSFIQHGWMKVTRAQRTRAPPSGLLPRTRHRPGSADRTSDDQPYHGGTRQSSNACSGLRRKASTQQLSVSGLGVASRPDVMGPGDGGSPGKTPTTLHQDPHTKPPAPARPPAWQPAPPLCPIDPPVMGLRFPLEDRHKSTINGYGYTGSDWFSPSSTDRLMGLGPLLEGPAGSRHQMRASGLQTPPQQLDLPSARL
ncbi:unnamed protein product [Gadus morhua 'NCC']